MASQDQSKRSFEGLTRRIAAEEAQLLLQNKKNEKTVDRKVRNIDVNTSFASSADVRDSSALSTLPASRKRGNFSLNSHTGSQGNYHVSLPLTVPIDERLLATTNVKVCSGKGSVVDKILRDLLQSGDSSHKYLQRSKSRDGRNDILLVNKFEKNSKDNGCLSKRSKKHKAFKKKEKCAPLPKHLHCRFDVYKPVHDSWVRSLNIEPGNTPSVEKLLGADLHGALILVADCKNNFFIGVTGFMILETAETLAILTKEDKVRVVPKKGSVFKFQIDRWEITLLGDSLILGS